MKNISTQEERLSFLVEQFKEDSRSYRDLETPEDVPGRQQLLRALMNVRSPRRMRADVLQVQDEYLKERSLERGIVTLQEIPTIREEGSGHPAGDILSLWQGQDVPGGRHRQRRKLPDAGMLHPHASLHRQLHPHLRRHPAAGRVRPSDE